MFTCSACSKAIGPKVKPIRVAAGYRLVEYTNTKLVPVNDFVSKEVEVHSTGQEIIGENLLCETCAGAPAPTDLQNSVSVLGRGFQEKLADPMKMPLGTIVIHTALERVAHKSKRAYADASAAIPLIKDFVDRNPGAKV